VVLAADLLIGGTGAALGTIQAIAKAYQKENSVSTIKVLPSLGSGGGIRALSNNKIDIAIIGRPMKKKNNSLA